MEDGEAEEAQRDAITARMRAQDYAGARALLLRTLQTNPRLEGALEMLLVLEVLCCAAGSAAGGRGGVDWYRVLQVLPGDDGTRIEARYKSIVAQVEPAMGALPGVELALKLVDEAYVVLSDPEKREGFNSRNVFNRFVRSGVVDAPPPGGTVVRSDRVNSLHTKEIRGADERAMQPRMSTTLLTGHVLMEGTPFFQMWQVLPGLRGWILAFMVMTASCSHLTALMLTRGKRVSVKRMLIACRPHRKIGMPALMIHHLPWKKIWMPALMIHLVPKKMSSALASSMNTITSRKIGRSRILLLAKFGQHYDWEKFPRRYALIVKVPTDKMQLYVSWFKPCPQTPEDKKWCHAGLPLVCGTFIAEEHHISLTCSTMFCHQIFSNNLNQHLEVYPQEGEVWAIYSNWGIGWYTDPRMWKNSAFSIVEILTSYSSESGCTVAHLVKVDGNGSVFQRHFKSGTEHLLRIHRDNLIMFSHRILLSDLLLRPELCLSLNIPWFQKIFTKKIHQRVFLIF
ncbi:unnamed protein product [Miscanthus lutarioriparius]|uniref:J domain-containing protein n=1 Tax=Miscanthus lutarioriparius TaxID=422564 RepID=A0A811P1Y5_9POAL|nr:unnamed protein product [Miscanthus lutarioriparius]